MLLRQLGRKRAIATTAAVLAILFLTLIPSPSRPPLPFSYELGVGRRWLADGILNLLLFVPLGLTAGWNSRSTWLTVICGLIFSTIIELAQTIVPGRDPALSDILFNTLGIVLGALLARHPDAWFSPDPNRSRILTSIAVVAAGAVMGATVLLLSPRGPAIVGRSGNDLLLRYPSRATTFGLDEPDYWLRDAFQRADSETVFRSLERDRNHWRLSTRPNEQVVLGPTVGQGWTLLGYPDAIGRRWATSLNGIWTLLLCLPIGYWARGRFRIAAVAMAIALLLLIPAIAGTQRTSLEEWIGATLGFLLGVGLGLLPTLGSRLRRV